MAKLARVKTPLFKKVTQLIKDRGKRTSDEEVSYPLLLPEMIIPPDDPVSRRDALKIYQQHMVDIGYFDKDDVRDFVARFQEEMSEKEEELKNETAWAKDSLNHARKEVKAETKRIKGLLRGLDKAEREGYTQEIDGLQEQIREAEQELEKHTQALKAFQKDKRSFVIDYVNEEVHGSQWRELLEKE